MQKLNFHLSEVHRIETSRFERLALNCFVRLINIVINLPQILYMILGHWLAICYLWWNLYLCVIVMSLAKEKVICTHPFHLWAKMANNPDHRVNYNSIIPPLPIHGMWVGRMISCLARPKKLNIWTQLIYKFMYSVAMLCWNNIICLVKIVMWLKTFSLNAKLSIV